MHNADIIRMIQVLHFTVNTMKQLELAQMFYPSATIVNISFRPPLCFPATTTQHRTHRIRQRNPASMFFSRLRCHFCGAKAPHPKTVTEFQCATCEAMNYLDGHGNIVDTPATVAAPPSHALIGHGNTKTFVTSTRPEPEALQHQRSTAFCRTCLQNQHLYNETLANYLPDESHPKYREFERAIPQYKKELEKRYPLVCTACAPEAQSKINRADCYGMTENATALCARTTARGGRSPIGQRDDAGKKIMRLILSVIGLVLYSGMLFQLSFHAYGILTTLFGTASAFPDFDIATYTTPAVQECSEQARSIRFNTQCFHLFGDYVPYSIALAILGLLYNPGLKEWYHHTLRIEAVNGQWNYFYMQLAILAIRCMAWWNVSDPQTLADLDAQQIIAIHAFTIFFALLTDSIARRSIIPTKWSIRGKIMPKPSDKDVLGLDAAPAVLRHAPKASEKDPFRHMRTQNKAPFDINSLAPKISLEHQPRSHSTFTNTQQFTPEYSDDNEDCDPMELDDAAYVESRFHNQRPNLQPSHSYYNHTNAPPLGLSNMREALTSLDRNMKTQDQRLRETNAAKFAYNPGSVPSPFYGKLPQAPMSLERRLRNPPQGGIQSNKAEPLVSERRDFMQLMRNGVKPVKFARPQKNTIELKQSDWVLPGDVKETGLEERFGSVFTLEDESQAAGSSSRSGFWGLFGM